VSARSWFDLRAARGRAAVVLLVLLPLVVVAACSGDGETSPTGPSGPTGPAPASGVANISGTWSGTSDWEQNNVHAITNVTMSINQNDRTVTGTLTNTSSAYQEWGATISGTVAGTSPDTQFVGTIELRAPPTTGTGMCTGSATFSGRSVSNSLRWDTSQLTIVSNTADQLSSACRGALRSVVLILGR
jgi:hypothetical protein